MHRQGAILGSIRLVFYQEAAQPEHDLQDYGALTVHPHAVVVLAVYMVEEVDEYSSMGVEEGEILTSSEISGIFDFHF